MITLERAPKLWDTPEKDAALTWVPITTTDGVTAMVVCANGHAGLITDHEIDAAGHVTPSVVCTETSSRGTQEEPCDWHEHIRLDGWEG